MSGVGKTPEYCPHCKEPDGDHGDPIEIGFEAKIDYFCQECGKNYTAIYVFDRVEK